MAAVPEANSRRNVKAKGEAKRESALTQTPQPQTTCRRPIAFGPPVCTASLSVYRNNSIAPSCYLGSQGYERAAAVQSCIESR